MLVDLLNRLETRALIWGGYASGHVHTPVGRVHYLDYRGEGTLPPVVILHGINSSAAAFRPLLMRLRGQFSRVVAPDFVGHGLSDAPNGALNPDDLADGLQAALDQVVPERFLLFGNSLGGMGAVRFAAVNADRIEGLMLCSPGGARQDPASLERFLDNFRMRSNADALAFMDKLFARRPWFARLWAPALRRHCSRAAIVGMLDQVTPDSLLHPDELACLKMPVHLLWGQADRLMPREHQEFYRAHLPKGHRFTEPEGMGHMPHIDNPARLARWMTSVAHEARGLLEADLS